MIYQMPKVISSMSPEYYHKAGIVKLPSRKSFDELSEYGLQIWCGLKYRNKTGEGKKDDAEIERIAQEHLRKRRILMERKETQRLSKLKRMEILCLK